MANRWGNSGNSDRLYFIGSKITADGDCSHENKRRLLLGRKAITNLDSILKSKGITLPIKVFSQNYTFSRSHVWMWELDCKESWVPNNWCFWTVVLRRLLRVPWTESRSNQSILKEISPEYLLEGLMLHLKLQYFDHLMWITDSLEKSLMLERLKAGGKGDDRRWDSWMVSLSQWTWIWVNSGSWWWTGKPGVLQSMGSQRVGHDWMTELHWTELVTLYEEERDKERRIQFWQWIDTL